MPDSIPSKLDECFHALDELLSDEDKQFVQDNDEKEFTVTMHHSLGQYIRNNWGLWAGSKLMDFFVQEAKLEHPDDMSSIILTSYWRKKHDQPLKIKEQIKYYQDYWKNQERKLE